VTATLFARKEAPAGRMPPTLAEARPGQSVSAVTGALVAALALLALIAGFWPDLIIGAAPLLGPLVAQ